MKGNDNLKKYLKTDRGDKQQACAYDGAYGTGGISDRGEVLVAGVCLKEQALTTDFTRKNIAPCIQYPFGQTGWPGYVCAYPYRFVLKYTHWPDYICLQLPDRSGNGTCLCAGGKWADSLISGFIDLVMGIPHILLLIQISFALGKGFKRRGNRHYPDTLDFFSTIDPRGSAPIKGKPFYKDR